MCVCVCVCVYMASDEAKFITGTRLEVDGEFTSTSPGRMARRHAKMILTPQSELNMHSKAWLVDYTDFVYSPTPYIGSSTVASLQKRARMTMSRVALSVFLYAAASTLSHDCTLSSSLGLDAVSSET